MPILRRGYVQKAILATAILILVATVLCMHQRSLDHARESSNVNQRLTSDPALDDSPVWSNDGKRIAFASSRAGYYDLCQIAASGEGPEELLYKSGEN